jgi:hypothetical protein
VVRSWPLFDLRVQTPDLILRLPNDEELDHLARRAVGHVLTPETAHFLNPWAMLGSPAFERGLLAWNWRHRAEWTSEKWRLQFAVFLDGQREPIG